MHGFNLKIDMGNDAMQTLEDIAEALERVASKLRDGRDCGIIMDLNGNSVGRWAVWE